MISENLRPITTLYENGCGICGVPIRKGSAVLWDKDEHKIYHYSCANGSSTINRKIEYDRHADTFFLSTEPNAYIDSLLNNIAGVEYSVELQSYVVIGPSPVSAKQILDVAELQSFEYDTDALFRLIELMKDGIEAVLRSSATSSDFRVRGLKRKQYPFQVVGSEFGITNKRVIIADQMGLGKTIEAMGIIAHMKLFPALIVCPAIVKLNWMREILAWMDISLEKIWTLDGRTPHLLPYFDIYICNYDILAYWAPELKKQHLQATVFDEIHYAKNGSSQRAKAAKFIAEDVEYVVGLTGTPILNRPEELISPLQIIDRLEELGGRKYFEKRYCDAKRDNFNRWNTSGATNLKELNERLRASGILIRRLKRDVLADLPSKLPPTVLPIELSNKAEYRKAEHDLARWLGERAAEDVRFKESIAHLQPLEQLKRTSDRKRSVEYRARKNEEQIRFVYLKRLSTEGKMHGIKDHINNFLQSEEKLVVFGWFQDTQKDLSLEWPDCAHALGQDSDKQRNLAIDRFQSDPSCKLLIASLKAIGIGVNLTSASYVAFAELGWNPAEHDQAEDRVHRIGQTEPVNVIYYIGVDTIEEDIISIIDSKRKMIAAATDGIAPTHQDITSLLIGRLLKKYKE